MKSQEKLILSARTNRLTTNLLKTASEEAERLSARLELYSSYNLSFEVRRALYRTAFGVFNLRIDELKRLAKP